jgi:hypothetical protein
MPAPPRRTGGSPLGTNYVAFGGALSFKELRRILAGIQPMPAHEYEIIVDTVNDQLIGLGINYRLT